MHKYAIIVAGGSGKRMGSALPKQFLPLRGKPVLYYSIKSFLDSYEDLKIILVLPVDFVDIGREIIDAWFEKDRIRIAAGGDTRFQSVKNGLAMVEEEAIIFVHDAVRCLLSGELIRRCYAMAMQSGSAIPVVTCKDSVRLLGDEDSESIDRDKVLLVQTPQTFHSRILLPAFEIDYKEKFTDEAAVVEAFGLKISLVEGESTNIKITTPVDLVIVEALLKQREQKAEA